MHTRATVLLAILMLAGSSMTASADTKLKALIVDGQNNHANWPETTQMMKGYLEETGLFTVAIARTAPEGTDPNFRPNFAAYDVVVSNYNGALGRKRRSEPLSNSCAEVEASL